MLEGIKIEEFADLYKNNIAAKEHSVDDYINLILIFWNASFDYGFESYCITKGIFTENEISNLPKEVEVLFDKAFNEFSDNKELQFWRLYIDDLNTYSECSHKKDMDDFSKINDFHLPYFYLYVQCDILFDKQLKQLKINLVNEKESYKNFYMLSYLNEIKII